MFCLGISAINPLGPSGYPERCLWNPNDDKGGEVTRGNEAGHGRGRVDDPKILKEEKEEENDDGPVNKVFQRMKETRAKEG